MGAESGNILLENAESSGEYIAESVKVGTVIYPNPMQSAVLFQLN
jgi:hypothetical protein